MELLYDYINSLGTAIASGVVLGIAAMVLVHKMIDGDLHPAPGLAGVASCLLLTMFSVRPPHPLMPGIVLVVALTLLTLFPFAEGQVERIEMQSIDTERLDKAFQTFAQKPDNMVAWFEIAKGLYAHGFRGHAIAIAQNSLGRLSTALDPVQNRSQRDLFRHEEEMLKMWHREARADPPKDRPLACPGCLHVNPIGLLACEKCGRTYLLDHARKMSVRPRVWGRMVLSWVAMALLIVGACYIGVNYRGAPMYGMLLFTVVALGLLMHWLFRAPQPKWR